MWAAQASLCRVAGLQSTLVKPGPLLLLHSLEENFLFSLDSSGTPECDAEPPGGGPGPAFLNLPVLESLSSLLDFIMPSNNKHTPSQHLLGMDLHPEVEDKSNNNM